MATINARPADTEGFDDLMAKEACAFTPRTCAASIEAGRPYRPVIRSLAQSVAAGRWRPD